MRVRSSEPMDSNAQADCGNELSEAAPKGKICGLVKKDRQFVGSSIP